MAETIWARFMQLYSDLPVGAALIIVGAAIILALILIWIVLRWIRSD